MWLKVYATYVYYYGFVTSSEITSVQILYSNEGQSALPNKLWTQ